MTSLLILPSVLVASAVVNITMVLRHKVCQSFVSCPGKLFIKFKPVTGKKFFFVFPIYHGHKLVMLHA